jgi:hypothetical protein
VSNISGRDLDAIIQRLHLHLDADLKRIAKRFKNPKITLVVRNPDVADGDLVLTDDDPALAIAAIRKAEAGDAVG